MTTERFINKIIFNVKLHIPLKKQGTQMLVIAEPSTNNNYSR